MCPDREFGYKMMLQPLSRTSQGCPNNILSDSSKSKAAAAIAPRQYGQPQAMASNSFKNNLQAF